jgi:putative transcriptional regulator
MSAKSERRTFFERLKAGLEEGIQHAQGKLTLRTTTVTAPDLPPERSAREVLELRQRFQMTQQSFAQLLNVSTKTVQSWEQGERKPSQAALRLLQVLAERPETVCQVVGIDTPPDGENARAPRTNRSKVK